VIPLKGRVLLRKPPVSDMIGSIVIPERARSVPQEGTVVAVSAGEVHQCPHCKYFYCVLPEVQVGQQVLHGRFERMGLPGQGDDLYLVWERDIMAVLE